MRVAVCGLRHGQGPYWGDSTGRNPTVRGKAGSKRSILVDGNGGPPSVVVAAANVHDTRLPEPSLESVVVECPYSGDERLRHLCLDKGYDSSTGQRAVAAHMYRRRIWRTGEEKLDVQGKKRYRARRWAVERTLGWLSKRRGILVRYDKKAPNYVALVQLACALLPCRRQGQLKSGSV